MGAFPAGTGSQELPAESHMRSIAVGKMMELGTLDQLIDYATQYFVNPESARPFVQRMFQLGDRNSDSRVWYRVGVVASRLKLGDLEAGASQGRPVGREIAGGLLCGIRHGPLAARSGGPACSCQGPVRK